MIDDQEQIALAQSYRELANSAAWRNLQEKMRSCVDLAEIQAVSVSADAPFRTRDALMREWQIRRKVELEIVEEFRKAQQFLIQIQEESENERASDRERAGRAGW